MVKAKESEKKKNWFNQGHLPLHSGAPNKPYLRTFSQSNAREARKYGLLSQSLLEWYLSRTSLCERRHITI